MLLVEAGGTDTLRAIEDPRAFVQLFNTSVDWGYVTAPEPELNGRSIAWPRGKVLGGTSAMNAMIYVRGNRADYDHWARLGNPGWGYEEVLPYFLKSERNSRGASDWHGADGLLDVTDPPAPHPYSLAFVDAAVELGHPRNPDFNGPRQAGAGLWQRTIKDTTRSSAARAFLDPARERANLHVITNAEVTRIVFDGKRASGVRYVRSGIVENASARHEVILCAGVINSPQLLMVSGIGRGDDLRRLGLSVLADLPGVGRNLQDHPLARIRCWTSEHRPVDPSSNLVEAGLFCSIGSGSGSAAPDLYFHFLPVAAVEARDGKIRSAFAIASVVLRPRSRGLLQLQSPDPGTPPIIRAGYYTDPADLVQMIEGLKIARAIAKARAFAGIVVEEGLPGPAVRTDADLETYVRATGDTIFHPVGTCKMGTDPEAVVDARLCVHGVERLRVIDASIMPAITSGNTNAPAIMIAEKGADMVRASRRSS